MVGAIAVACANGTIDDDDDGGLPVAEEDSGEPVPTSTGRDSSTPPLRDASPPPTDAATSDGSTDGGTIVDGGDGGTTTPDGGTSPTACNSPNACLGATIMTDVSGDSGSDVSTISGTTSQWVKIRVSEDDSNVFANDLELKLTLTSPPGTVFNMRVYLASDGSSQKCTGPDRTTTSTTTSATTSIEWGESGTFSNNNDDDRTVTIEIFNTSGTCAAGQTWTLRAEGNKT